MDDDHASYRELVLKLETRFGRKIAPFQLPIRENEKFVGFVNVVKMAGRRFTDLSNYTECEIPDYEMCIRDRSGTRRRSGDTEGLMWEQCRDAWQMD